MFYLPTWYLFPLSPLKLKREWICWEANFSGKETSKKEVPILSNGKPWRSTNSKGTWYKESKEAESKFAHEAAIELFKWILIFFHQMKTNHSGRSWLKRSMEKKMQGKPKQLTLYMGQCLEDYRNLLQIFSINISLKVGNGHKISVWEDNWLGSGLHLGSFYPHIDEVWNNQGWDLSFRMLLNDWKMDRIIGFLNSQSLQWSLTRTR